VKLSQQDICLDNVLGMNKAPAIAINLKDATIRKVTLFALEGNIPESHHRNMVRKHPHKMEKHNQLSSMQSIFRSPKSCLGIHLTTQTHLGIPLFLTNTMRKYHWGIFIITQDWKTTTLLCEINK